MNVSGLRGIHSWISGAAALAAALCFFGAAAAQEATQDVLSRITVEGNERYTDESVIAQTGLRIGEVITPRHVQEAVKRLWASGRFADITPYIIEGDNGSLELRLDVKEQPQITFIEFEGLENLRPSAVLDSVQLRPGPLNPAKVARTETMVRQMLAEKGYQVRSISHRLEPVEGRPNEARLVFDVEEGTRVALAEVEFIGNEVFTDEQLRGVLTTKPEGFLWFRQGTFDDERLRTDLRETLPNHYASAGYLDFTVINDSIAVDPFTGKARLIVEVEEGPQYTLADFEIRGNRRFSTDDLMRYFNQARGGMFGFGGDVQQMGEPFDATSFLAATDRVRQLYRNQGFLYSQVQPAIEKVPNTNTVRVAWDIVEGNPAYINRVIVRGNTYTHEDVIRGQLLVFPEDVYNEELLIQSYQRLSALGFFETPLPMPEIQEAGDGNVNIVFNVKEKQTGSVNFGTAVGGGTGLAGFLGYDQPNLFGKAKAGHLRWEFGQYSNNFTASYTDPAINDSQFSGSLSLFSSRDQYITFSEGQRRRTGFGLRFGVPVPNDPRSRFSVGYSLSRTTYEDFESDESTSLFSLPPGVLSTLSLGLTRTTLDHPLFPTSGSRQEFEAIFNGGPLGGDGDFQKYLVNSAWYVPVGRFGGGAPGSRPARMTLGLQAEGGALFGNASRFPFERFSMGGVQFGRPLRGYDETTVTPLGYIPRCDGTSANCPPLEDRFGDAYLRLSAEYALRLNDNISLSAFYDAGAVWNRPSDFNPTRLLRGAGVGVMLVTPFGPIGLDYAYGFDKDVPGWQLHFKFGQGF